LLREATVEQISCNNCFYCGMCRTNAPSDCGFYTPADEDADLDKAVEAGRPEYLAAWYAYIENDD